ncbi:MAG: LacI family DNA-binding transcriptional regulator [Tropicimonas sp.]|uniref:LacI family DNA-binding transcriptional regulator n=1 Tax=Tropicimonas sp. TaxID=2067044 RepID=UPI003A886B5B
MTTIARVARHAGVSPTTVSHTLNQPGRVSPHLRARVLKAIEELGYTPNAHAKSLRTGKTNNVALLIPDILNPFYTEIVNTAQHLLSAAGREVLILNADVPSGDAQQHSREYLSKLRARGIEGLIVGDFALHDMYDAVRQIPVPTVFIGHLPDGGVDNVRADDYHGCFRIGAHLAGRGHRRILHITGPGQFPAADVRRQGFRDGATAGGMPSAGLLEYEGSYLSPSGYEGVKEAMSRHAGDPPDAVFFSNYLMLLGGLAAIHDLGLRIPDDLAVGVYGDNVGMDYIRPKLTHIGVPPSDLARAACRMLLERLSQEYQGPPRREILDCALRVEASG